MSKRTNKNKLVELPKQPIQPCTKCNPKLYLKFNFTFSKSISNPKNSDCLKLIERLHFLSQEKYDILRMKYIGNKQAFIEYIPVKQIDKDIPKEFRELFPIETNERYAVFRIYPSGTAKGTANPRIIGMIKNTIFYVLFMDWDGKLYKH